MSYPPQQPNGHQPDPQQPDGQFGAPHGWPATPPTGGGAPSPVGPQPYSPEQPVAAGQPYPSQQPFPAAGGFAGAAQQLVPPPKRNRWLQIVGAIVAAIAIGVAFYMFVGKKVIDDQKVKDTAISLLKEQGIDVTLSDFKCPDMPAEAGKKYTCTASEDGVALNITVSVQNSDGDVLVEVNLAG